LQLYFLELDGRAIASGIGCSTGDTFQFLKSGYDEEFHFLSPSVLLLTYMTEHLSTNFPQLRRIHQFPWNYGYKDRYNFERATCIDTIVYGRTGRGKLVQLTHGLKAALRRTPGLLWTVNSLRRLAGRSR